MKIKQHGKLWIADQQKDHIERCPECNSADSNYVIDLKSNSEDILGKSQIWTVNYTCKYCDCKWSHERTEEYK